MAAGGMVVSVLLLAASWHGLDILAYECPASRFRCCTNLNLKCSGQPLKVIESVCCVHVYSDNAVCPQNMQVHFKQSDLKDAFQTLEQTTYACTARKRRGSKNAILTIEDMTSSKVTGLKNNSEYASLKKQRASYQWIQCERCRGNHSPVTTKYKFVWRQQGNSQTTITITLRQENRKREDICLEESPSWHSIDVPCKEDATGEATCTFLMKPNSSTVTGAPTIGPIVGGAVGGAYALAIFAVLMFLYLRRGRTDDNGTVKSRGNRASLLMPADRHGFNSHNAASRPNDDHETVTGPMYDTIEPDNMCFTLMPDQNNSTPANAQPTPEDVYNHTGDLKTVAGSQYDTMESACRAVKQEEVGDEDYDHLNGQITAPDMTSSVYCTASYCVNETDTTEDGADTYYNHLGGRPSQHKTLDNDYDMI